MLPLPRFITGADPRPAQPGIAQQRRRHLIDRQLQGWLLAALVILEVGMLLLALLYLYLRFGALIEANLYVVHAAARTGLLPAMLSELLKVILVMGVVNTLALLLAHTLWSRHVERVVRAFRNRTARLAALDFTEPEDDQATHEVVARLERWREAERGRLLAVREQLAELRTASDEELQVGLLKCRTELLRLS